MHKLLPMLALAALGCAPSDDGGDRDTGLEAICHRGPPLVDPAAQTDTIVQAIRPEVDVLWVVDDSGSALDEQTRLAADFPEFLRSLKGLEYHVGVVTTDMDDPDRQGRLVTWQGQRYVDPDTPDPAATFSELVRAGTSGSDVARGNDATYAALKTEQDAHNLGFLRKKSSVHVIVVSDRPDASEIPPEQLASYLDGLRTDPGAVTHSSIVQGGDGYEIVSRLVGGTVWDVAGEDWAPVLDRLGFDASGLQREFFLSQLPELGSIHVAVIEHDDITYSFTEGEDWTYDPVRNSITFREYVPRPTAEVGLEYRRRSVDRR